MSDDERAYVWRQSPYKGTAFVIHLLLGDVANEGHQYRLWMGDAWIARRARCDERTVRRARAQMIADGYLTEAGTDSVTGNRQYVFEMPPDKLSTGHSVLSDRTFHPDRPDISSTAPITNRNKEPNRTALVACGEAFDAFWAAYPRRAGKLAARKAWAKAVLVAQPDVIIAGAVRYRDDPNRDASFTAHPSTWLNQGRWADDPEPPRGGVVAGTPRPPNDPMRGRHATTLDEEMTRALGG